jgi:hypothetical protein
MENARLDLGVAVGTEEDALRGLFAKNGHRPSQPAAADAEPLRARIDVVERQRSQAAVVAAASTSPAGFVDENLFRATAPARHRVGGAARTARSPIIANDVLALAVFLTEDEDTLRAGDHGPCRTRAVRRPQAMALKPIAHARRAAPDRCGDLANRQVTRDEFRQLCFADGSARCVLVRMGRPKAELVHPVRHCRRMPIDTPSDLLDRQPFGDPALQHLPFHDPNTSSHRGRKAGFTPSPDRPRDPAAT